MATAGPSQGETAEDSGEDFEGAHRHREALEDDDSEWEEPDLSLEQLSMAWGGD